MSEGGWQRAKLCPDVRYLSRDYRIIGPIRQRTDLSAFDPMYGPAVRRKWISPSWR